MPTTWTPEQAAGSAQKLSLRHPARHPALSEREKRVLAFEGTRWRFAGAKETAIWKEFGWSATRHYQVVNALLDRPEAAAFAPVLVSRLRRVREARQTVRSARRR